MIRQHLLLLDATASPADPQTSLLAQWDAANAVRTLLVVTSVPDSSGTGDANKNATAIGAPTYTASDAQYNGQPTIHFVGTLVQGLKTGAWAVPLAQPFTMIVVGHATTSDVEFLFAGIDGAHNVFAILQNATQSNGNVAFQNPSLDIQTPNTLALSSPFGAAFVGNGATSKIYLNNFTTAVVTGNADVGGATGITLAVDNDGATLPFTGTIAFAAVYSGVLPPTEMTQLRDYLNARYGLAIA